MENNNLKALRTHYSPINRKNSNLTHYKSCKSYYNNPCYNHKKALNINTNPLYTEIFPSKNTSPYKTLCNECINYPYNNYHYQKKNINLDISEKEKLNNSFNRINPFYFKDKVDLIEKEKTNEKVKNQILIQREAIKQLSINKLKNPSEKEKLQKINELSENPMLSYESKPPFQIKTLNNYYYNEHLIKNNLNLYSKPRKEIEDYFNRCQYQFPTNISAGSITHTKGNYIYPNYNKNNYCTNIIKEELDKQVECKNNKKRKKYIEDEKNRKIMNKVYNDYEMFLKTKEKEEKLKKEKEIMIDNNLLEYYKNYEKKYFNDGEKEYMKNINKKMEEEDLQKKYEEKQEKLKTMKNLREWNEINRKIQEKKKNEKSKEKKIWRNYSEAYMIRCKHGGELYKCCRCGRNFTRGQVHKINY